MTIKKMLPLVTMCKNCYFCVSEYIDASFSMDTVKRCKYPDLEREWQGKDPLTHVGIDYEHFPNWCPLVDVEIEEEEKMSDSWEGIQSGHCPKGGDSECVDCTYMLDELLWMDCPKLEEKVFQSIEEIMKEYTPRHYHEQLMKELMKCPERYGQHIMNEIFDLIREALRGEDDDASV